MAGEISRQEYAARYGPTAGDRIRLGDTNLVALIERDETSYGDEVLRGWGKTMRTGLMMNDRLPAASERVLFHTFLPDSPRPPVGYPVILFGHGLNDSRFGAPTLVASTFARAGFATLAINAVGHGSGPRGVLRLRETSGAVHEIPTGGRSLDRDRDGDVESAEGCLIAEPDLLARFTRLLPPVKSIEQDARDWEQRYVEVVERSGSRRMAAM